MSSASSSALSPYQTPSQSLNGIPNSSVQPDDSHPLLISESPSSSSSSLSYQSISQINNEEVIPILPSEELVQSNQSEHEHESDSDSDDGDEHPNIIEKMAKDILSLIKPVSLTITIVIWAVLFLNSSGTQSSSILISSSSSPSSGNSFSGALVDSLIVLASLIGITFFIACLYKHGCTKIIWIWLIVSTITLLGTLGYLWQSILVFKFNLDKSIDFFTFYFLLWNFAAVGVTAIFWHAALSLQQTYLIIVSAMLAWQIDHFPAWTLWCLLSVVAIWDLFAVLAPRGPLKEMVETAVERNEPIPGLIYSAPRIKLGLGDFIFYSVLVGRAALSDVSTIFACFLSILTVRHPFPAFLLNRTNFKKS